MGANADERIKTICDVIKNDAIEPAKAEAERIIEEAEKLAAEIIKTAEEAAKNIILQAEEKAVLTKSQLESEIKHSIFQSVSVLKQEIENNLFSNGIVDFLKTDFNSSATVSKLVEAIVTAIEKDGINSKMEVFISKKLSKEELIHSLVSSVKEKLSSEGIKIGKFFLGAQIKLIDKNILLDISEESIKELLGKFFRKEFRTFLFG